MKLTENIKQGVKNIVIKNPSRHDMNKGLAPPVGIEPASADEGHYQSS